MGKALRRLLTTLMAILVVSSVSADSTPRPILRAAFSEIDRITVEWCDSSQAEFVVCYGTAQAHFASSIRAVVIRKNDETHTYIDSDFRGIDLFRLKIRLIGPLENKVTSEIGEAQLFVDPDGEITGIRGFLPSLGEFAANCLFR